MGSLQDKVAIITGAGTGIGRGIAEAFLQEGAKVALVGRRLGKLEEVAAGLSEGRTLCCSCDVSDRAAVKAMAEQVVTALGPPDILVNNAGTNTNPRAVGEVSLEDWDRTIDINLHGVFSCVRAVLPGMRERKDGLIINVSSIAGKRASKLAGAAYCASKHGVVALTHSINDEESGNGIRSTAICPGEVETPILDLRVEPVSAEHRARILKPEDIAAAALFVAKLPPRACVPELLIKPTQQLYS